MKKALKISFVISLLLTIFAFAAYFYLPVNRVRISSELIMLGDLNNDNHWDIKDRDKLNHILQNPFEYDPVTLVKTDLNRNGLIDNEDILFLNNIFTASNPYKAEAQSKNNGVLFPRPRELFFYLPKYEYIQPPVFTLNHAITKEAPFDFLSALKEIQKQSAYTNQLLNEIYSESIRFSIAYKKRKANLSPLEKSYVENKIHECNNLFKEQEYYILLLRLISLVEDAETLTTSNQSDFILNILYFRDHLKQLLVSSDFKDFEQGKQSYSDIYLIMEKHLKSDLKIDLKIDQLQSPRDLTDISNYMDRAEWQAYKSSTDSNNFHQLVLFAQHDRRYLRAVSNTSPKFTDIQLQNHNLPMILLFRKALEISDNNKKAAIALLDEAVRIPLGWVKSIPKNILPSSIALENFLLPGNMEDGSDKTRHWNVFGGISIYKSPEESLILSLKRERMDLQENNHSPEAMREFIRDTIANINGIYYIISIDPDLSAE